MAEKLQTPRILAGTQTPVANFIFGDPNNHSGIRVA